MPRPVQPVVLVGGHSRRFGRDKLREPWRGSAGGQWLVDQPRLTLLKVFGPPLWAAGPCDPDIAVRFDVVLPDAAPDRGPVAGILSALLFARGPVFIASGDLPALTPETVRAILLAGDHYPTHDAVVGSTDRPEPCIGLYRLSAIPFLREAVEGSADHSLHAILTRMQTHLVPIPAAEARNANHASDLPTS